MGTFWSVPAKALLSVMAGDRFLWNNLCWNCDFQQFTSWCFFCFSFFFFTFFFRCRNLTFPDRLPEVSIVFIFVNEALSVILRSIHSAIDRTPAHLLKEIILVDDNSSNGKRFCFCSFLPRPEVGSYMRILEFRLILIPLAFQTLSVYFLPSSSRSCWAVFKYAQVGHVKKSMFKERMLFLYV